MESPVRVLAVVQARLGSTRLPRKALCEVAGRPMLHHVLARAAAIPGVDQVVLATTTHPEDDALCELAGSAGVAWARGSADDVLDRFHVAVREFPAGAVVRLTADCPLLDPVVSGLVVERYLDHADRIDYVSNVDPPTYPDGLDTEVFSTAALERAWREARSAPDREHVTPFIRRARNGFRRDSVRHHDDLSGHRWTVDEPRDLEFVRAVYAALAPDGRRIFGMDEVLALVRAHPELTALNAGIPRNEGFERSLTRERALVADREPRPAAPGGSG